MTRGHRDSLRLRCRAFSSPSPCRFIPALSPAVHPHLATLAAFAAPNDQGAKPVVVGAGTDGTHHGDDLLDRRRIGRVLLALVARGAASVIAAWARPGNARGIAARIPWFESSSLDEVGGSCNGSRVATAAGQPATGCAPSCPRNSGPASPACGCAPRTKAGLSRGHDNRRSESCSSAAIFSQ